MPETVTQAWILSPLGSGDLIPSFISEIAADNFFADREGVLVGDFASFSVRSATVPPGQSHAKARAVKASQGIRVWKIMVLRPCGDRAAREFVGAKKHRYVKVDAPIPRAATMNGRTSSGTSARKPTAPPATPPKATTAARTLLKIEAPSFTRSRVVSGWSAPPAVSEPLLSELSVMR